LIKYSLLFIYIYIYNMSCDFENNYILTDIISDIINTEEEYEVFLYDIANLTNGDNRKNYIKHNLIIDNEIISYNTS